MEALPQIIRQTRKGCNLILATYNGQSIDLL